MNRRDLTAVQVGAFLAYAVMGGVILAHVPDTSDRVWLAVAFAATWLLAMVWCAADVAKTRTPPPPRRPRP